MISLYDVSWGLGRVRHQHVRAANAVDACLSVANRYGWRRGSSSVDAKTRGLLRCEMVCNRSDFSQVLLIAVSLTNA